jgi:hypothetical protein
VAKENPLERRGLDDSRICGEVVPLFRLTDAVATDQRRIDYTMSAKIEKIVRRIECSKAPWASDEYSAAGRTILLSNISPIY